MNSGFSTAFLLTMESVHAHVSFFTYYQIFEGDAVWSSYFFKGELDETHVTNNIILMHLN